MGGKGALLLVLGFSLIFMVAGRNFNNMATSSTDNFTNYYMDAKARNIASSGINIVANKLFLNKSLVDQTFNYNIDSGSVAVTLSTVGDQRQIVATGNFSGTTALIKLILQSSSFSKFAYFSDNEGADIWWTTKDTVWGPFHTNGQLRVADEPVFYGDVSIDGSLVKRSHTANPHFYGNFETGVHIDIPPNGVANLAAAASAGGALFTGHPLVYFEFRGDSIRYKFSSGGSWTYALASTFAPNGVIFAADAQLRIEGVVKGQYTIGASGSGSGKGKIYLDDDVYYYTNPETDPSSTDLLGIVAYDDIVITENWSNNHSITIQAAMYSETGSFGAEDYQHRPVSGNINLYGGLTQDTRGAVGTFYTDWWGNSIINSGFSKRYRYDDRLMTKVPPTFPSTGALEVVSWFE